MVTDGSTSQSSRPKRIEGEVLAAIGAGPEQSQPQKLVSQDEGMVEVWRKCSSMHSITDGASKDEAIQGRNRMLATPGILRDDSDQNAQPPFGNAQINETAIHLEILKIYQLSSPETRIYYDKGRDTEGVEEENWVIRWLLWHVFRYRDNRNKNRRQVSPGARNHSSSERSSSENHGIAASGELLSSQQPTCPVTTIDLDSTSTAGAPKTGFYDPVRDN